jgi:hypothetical protein
MTYRDDDGRGNMKSKDLLGLYGRLGVILAAFAFMVGIVGAPLLPWLSSPITVIAQR